MNGGLKLGTALTLVIAVSLLVGLVGQIFYILWRRRKLHNRSLPDHHTESGLPGGSASSQSRGLFMSFFLCRKNQSRIEPQEARHNVDPAPPDYYSNNDLQELEDIIKWQALYGSSRVLFTIEEGEREGLDSETTYSSCADQKEVVVKTTAKVYLEECYGAPDVVVTVVNIEMDEEAFTTPLETTPCASPPYYTPAASPTRE